jgi:kumamolisin
MPSLGLGPLIVLLSLVAAILAAHPESLPGAPRSPLKGTHPTQVDLSRVPEAPKEQKLHLEILFALRNKAEMERFGEDVQDPASPRYHHWMTQEESNAHFGPKAQDVRAVQDWLVGEGFSITEVNFGKLPEYMRFTGTVAQAEHAFGTIVVSIGGDRFTNTTDILIPERFKDVIGYVAVLDNLGAIYIPQWRLRDRNSNFWDWLKSPHR